MSVATAGRAPAEVGRRPAFRVSVSARRGIIGIVVVLLLWELLARSGFFSAATLPSATAVLAEMGRALADGSVLTPLTQTLRGWAIGLAIVVVVAVPVGVLIGRVELLNRSVRPIFEFLRPIPGVTFLPLLLLMFGPTTTMKVWMIAIAAIWPLLYQTYYGVKAVDPVSIDTARVFQIGAFDRARKLFLPATLPFIATGFRISSAIALIVAVVAELIGGAPGLGERIYSAQTGGAYDTMYAYIGFTGCLGAVLNFLTRLVERRLLSWHVLHREEVA